jgi:predicted enzyme related to lactoylglutathione lyase
MGVKVPVTNIAKSRAFYNQILGLKVQKESSSFVSLEGPITLVPVRLKKSFQSTLGYGEQKTQVRPAMIYIETSTLELAFRKIERFGALVLVPITERDGQRLFQCYDPDGNILEILEVLTMG